MAYSSKVLRVVGLIIGILPVIVRVTRPLPHRRGRDTRRRQLRLMAY